MIEICKHLQVAFLCLSSFLYGHNRKQKLKTNFSLPLQGKKTFHIRKKRQNMVKKGRKEKTRLPIMKCFLISQAYQKWNRVLAFDPEPTKQSGSITCSKVLHFDSAALNPFGLQMLSL